VDWSRPKKCKESTVNKFTELVAHIFAWSIVHDAAQILVSPGETAVQTWKIPPLPLELPNKY
jgi:hypothetical protein